jgi:putative glutamine amidotransferase
MHGPQQAAREEPTWASFDPYLDAVRRAGGEPVPLDPTASRAERERALAGMDGQPHPAVVVEGARDDLELAAWFAARARGVPIFGVCRGFQAINVFSGGKLEQHLEGHDSPTSAPEGHPLHLEPASRLAMMLGNGAPLRRTEVNSYHHQAVRRDDLAPGLAVSGTAPHDEGELVEALEAADPDDWLIGVQFHPERPEFIGPEFDRLWRAFVDAARSAAHRS